jgi:hypothetical protein
MQLEQRKLPQKCSMPGAIECAQRHHLACTIDLLEISKDFDILTFDRKYL